MQAGGVLAKACDYSTLSTEAVGLSPLASSFIDTPDGLGSRKSILYYNVARDNQFNGSSFTGSRRLKTDIQPIGPHGPIPGALLHAF